MTLWIVTFFTFHSLSPCRFFLSHSEPYSLGRSAPDDVRRLGLPDHHTGAFYLDDPVGGPCMNIMKAGIEYATKVRALWGVQLESGVLGLVLAGLGLGRERLRG